MRSPSTLVPLIVEGTLMVAETAAATTVPSRAYTMAPGAAEGFTKRIEALARRAEKLGCEPPTYEVSPPYGRKTEGGGVEAVVDVTVTGARPRFEGWTFVAALERFDKGVLIRAVPGESVPERYRDPETALECDHCRAIRGRKATYLVRHEGGRWARVGSTCLKDFLGHNFPMGIAALTAAFSDLDVLGKGMGGGAPAFCLPTFLAHVACAVRTAGWVSRKEAYDTNRCSTADAVLIDFDRRAKGFEPGFVPTEADRAEAEAAIAWAVAVEPENDYLHNCRIVAESAIATDRTAGIAASIVAAAARARGEEVRKRVASDLAATSRHFGEVGKRETWEADCIGHFTSEGFYGTTHIYKFVVGGNAATWFSSKMIEGLAEGGHYWLTGSVKKHGEYKGTAETHLTRCKVATEAPKAKRSRRSK